MDSTLANHLETENDLLDYLEAETREQAKRHVYKYTDCGAWINFEDDHIIIGSIVEGCDINMASYELFYPFSKKDYEERIEAIEKEADALWEWANNDDSDIDAPNVWVEFLHLNPIFI